MEIEISRIQTSQGEASDDSYLLKCQTDMDPAILRFQHHDCGRFMEIICLNGRGHTEFRVVARLSHRKERTGRGGLHFVPEIRSYRKEEGGGGDHPTRHVNAERPLGVFEVSNQTSEPLSWVGRGGNGWICPVGQSDRFTGRE